MKYLALLILGVLTIGFSIPNLRGNIYTIHWYNRRRVSEADAPRYSRIMGSGTLVMGVSITLTALLQMIFDMEFIYNLTLIGVAIGLAVMLYAQFKYNKGIF